MGGRRRTEVKRVLLEQCASGECSDLDAVLKNRPRRKWREKPGECKAGEPSEPDPTVDSRTRVFESRGSRRHMCGCSCPGASATHVKLFRSSFSSSAASPHSRVSSCPCCRVESLLSSQQRTRLSWLSEGVLENSAFSLSSCPLWHLGSRQHCRCLRNRPRVWRSSSSSSSHSVASCLRGGSSLPERRQGVSRTTLHCSPLFPRSCAFVRKLRWRRMHRDFPHSWGSLAVSSSSLSLLSGRSAGRSRPLWELLCSRCRGAAPVEHCRASATLCSCSSVILLTLEPLSCPLLSFLPSCDRNAPTTADFVGVRRISSGLVPRRSCLWASKCLSRALHRRTFFLGGPRARADACVFSSPLQQPTILGAALQLDSASGTTSSRKPRSRYAGRRQKYRTFARRLHLRSHVFLQCTRRTCSALKSLEPFCSLEKDGIYMAGSCVAIVAFQRCSQASLFGGKLTQSGKAASFALVGRCRLTGQTGCVLISTRWHPELPVLFVLWEEGGLSSSLLAPTASPSLVISRSEHFQPKRHWPTSSTIAEARRFLGEISRCCGLAGRNQRALAGPCRYRAPDRDTFLSGVFEKTSFLKSVPVRVPVRVPVYSLPCTVGDAGAGPPCRSCFAREVPSLPGGGSQRGGDSEEVLKCRRAVARAGGTRGGLPPPQSLAALRMKCNTASGTSGYGTTRNSCETDDGVPDDNGATWAFDEWQGERVGGVAAAAGSGLAGEVVSARNKKRFAIPTPLTSCLSVSSSSPAVPFSTAVPDCAVCCKGSPACVACSLSSTCRLDSSSPPSPPGEAGHSVASGLSSCSSLHVPLLPSVPPSPSPRLSLSCTPSSPAHATRPHPSSARSPSLSPTASSAISSSHFLLRSFAPPVSRSRTGCRALPAPPRSLFFSVPVHGLPRPSNGSPPSRACKTGQQLAPDAFELEGSSLRGPFFFREDETAPDYNSPRLNGTSFIPSPMAAGVQGSAANTANTRLRLGRETLPPPQQGCPGESGPGDGFYQGYPTRLESAPAVPGVAVIPPSHSESGGQADNFFPRGGTGKQEVLEDDEDDEWFVPHPTPAFLASRGPEIARGQEVAHREALSNMFRLDDSPIILIKPKQQQEEKRSKTSKIRSLFRSVISRGRPGDRASQKRAGTLNMGGSSWEEDPLSHSPMSDGSLGGRGLGLSSESTSYEPGVGAEAQAEGYFRPGSLSWSVELPMEGDSADSPWEVPPGKSQNSGVPSGQSRRGGGGGTSSTACRRGLTKEAEREANRSGYSPYSDKRAPKETGKARSGGEAKSVDNTTERRGSTDGVADSFWCCCSCVDDPDDEGRERISTGRRKERTASAKRSKRSSSRRKVPTEEKVRPMKHQQSRAGS